MTIASETLVQANYHSFKYKFHMNQALKGNKKSLNSLLLFSDKTDAAGELRQKVVDGLAA